MKTNFEDLRKKIIKLFDEELTGDWTTSQNWFKNELANKIIIILSNKGIFGGVVDFRNEPELSKLISVVGKIVPDKKLGNKVIYDSPTSKNL